MYYSCGNWSLFLIMHICHPSYVCRSDCNDGPALFVSVVGTYEDKKTGGKYSLHYQDSTGKLSIRI